MSGSDPNGVLSVASPGARIDVLDAWLRPVPGSGVDDRLELSLPEGVYRVTASLGGADASRLVVVDSDEPETHEIPVYFAAAGSVPGTSTENETHGELARRLTGRSSEGLVIVLRGLRETPMAPLAEVVPELIDQQGERVPLPEPVPDDLVVESRAVGWAVSVPPGGYELRWPAAGADRLEAGSRRPQPISQSVWVSEGWQTLLFVPQGPTGPVPAAASIQLTLAGQEWDQYDPESLALEAGYAALRQGRGPSRTEAELERIRNPALLLVTLHRILTAARDGRDGRWHDAFERLVSELGMTPDVFALGATIDSYATADAGPVSWPPSLAGSLDLLLLQDNPRFRRPLLTGTADFVTGLRLHSAPWLLWDPAGFERRPPSRRGSAVAEAPPRVARQRVIDLVEELADSLERPPNQVVRRFGIPELARRLRMSQSMVGRCVDYDRLRGAEPPEQNPWGGRTF